VSSQQGAELNAVMRQLPLDFGGNLAEQRGAFIHSNLGL
jgi:hypothetical protein